MRAARARLLARGLHDLSCRETGRLQLQTARLRRGEGQCGAVTRIQRFGSALNLNVHFHMLLPDGAYVNAAAGPVFRPSAAPTREELQGLVRRIGERLGAHLDRRGVLVRDAESSHLEIAADSDEDCVGGDAGPFDHLPERAGEAPRRQGIHRADGE